MKICNQYPVKDSIRDKRFTMTVKCACCNEQSNFNEAYPITLTTYVQYLSSFQAIHEYKGCNKKRIDCPDWAASSFETGISI